MKKLNFWTVIFALFLLFYGNSGLFSSSKETSKIAVLDFKKVFKHARERKTIEDWLDIQSHLLEKKILKFKGELQQLHSKLKILHPESKITQEVKWKIKLKALKLKHFVRFQKAKLIKTYKEKLKKALKKVRLKSLDILKKENYKIILNIQENFSFEKEDEIGVFYYHPQINVTQKLIKILK